MKTKGSVNSSRQRRIKKKRKLYLKYKKKKLKKNKNLNLDRKYHSKNMSEFGFNNCFWNNYRDALTWRKNFWNDSFYQCASEPTELEDVESNDEYELSDEMIAFLEISMRHKASREKEKKKKDESQPERRSEEFNLPAVAEMEKKRSDELKILYGKDAAKIQGMETAFQLSFNRQCDRLKPSYWPILPFDIKFK